VNTYHKLSNEPFEAEPPLDELLAETLGLIDEIVRARLANGELARRRDQIKMGGDQRPTAIAPPTDRQRTGFPSEALGDVYDVRRRLIMAAERDAEQIREDARHTAERYQDAALSQAAVTVAAARSDAEQILDEARQTAGGMADAANRASGRPEGQLVTHANRMYYQRGGIVVTDQHLTVDGERFNIAELSNVWMCRSPQRSAAFVAAPVVMVVLEIAASLWNAGWQVAAGFASVALVSSVIAATVWSRKRRRYELWATCRGNDVRLLTIADAKTYGQLCRALIRAREARETASARDRSETVSQLPSRLRQRWVPTRELEARLLPR
jgi:hypothetical protein